MGIVVIDPGHGGTSDVGGSSHNNARGPTGLLEKKAVFDVARAAVQRLRNLGHETRLTREADVNLALRSRASVAQTLPAKVFVSIHFNGSADSAVQGTETWVYLLHAEDSALLATSVQGHVRATTGYRERGVKKSRLGVLRFDYHDAGTAACLAEISFMSQAAEENRLRNADYIDRLGRAVAQGVDDFIRGVCTESAPVSEAEVPVPDGDI